MKSQACNRFFGISLLALWISFTAFAGLLLAIFLFPYLLFKDEATAIEIQRDEVNEYLGVSASIPWPNWDLENITYHDDHFTGPWITAAFKNGILLRLSTARFEPGHQQEHTFHLNGAEWKYYSDREQKFVPGGKGKIRYLLIAPKEMDEQLFQAYVSEFMLENEIYQGPRDGRTAGGVETR